MNHKISANTPYIISHPFFKAKLNKKISIIYKTSHLISHTIKMSLLANLNRINADNKKPIFNAILEPLTPNLSINKYTSKTFTIAPAKVDIRVCIVFLLTAIITLKTPESSDIKAALIDKGI